MQHDSTNTIFSLAADLVNFTSRDIFLTGKAGTGKTTFLKYLKEHTQKNAVIVAPTGVAAINAGGVTMHSFFQLPFGPFVPSSLNNYNSNETVTDKHSLFKNIRFASDKRELLQELQLLIIDEVSMVRCDMLDAIDAILRHFRKQYHVLFGGVQVVYIGDLFQLPPVIPQHEWSILQEHYASPFFFDAKALKEAPPLYVELKKIYRQNEQHFIDILNRIRNASPEPHDLVELNKRFHPGFISPPEEKFITLSTHNKKADVINEAELKKLPGKLHVFKADIEGEFSEKSLPTEMNLQLKEQAQIMFIKNDSGGERRYYNGKLATVKKIAKDEITISFEDGEDLKLEKETWKNIRYNYNKESDDIDEEQLGSFKQYPIRLAWAITIHKSQGLTFEKAIIDAGSSFAAGQVYVALSRCTSLNGLILHSKIHPHSIATDKRVLRFAEQELDGTNLQKILSEEKEKFQSELLIKSFNWSKVLTALYDWKALILGKKIPNVEATLLLCEELLSKAKAQHEVAEKFQSQLRQILKTRDDQILHQRVNKAVFYFAKALVEEIIQPLQTHMASLRFASKVAKYTRQLKTIEATILGQLQKLNSIAFKDLVFEKYHSSPLKSEVDTPKPKTKKPQKGESHQDTLALFREGKSVQEISELRHLTVGTIEGHLASLVLNGEVQLDELVSTDKSKAILEVIKDETMSSGAVKQLLPSEFTYGEIKAVMNWLRLQKENKLTSHINH